MDMLGDYSLSEATTQQIKSVYAPARVGLYSVAPVVVDGEPLHLLPPAEPVPVAMDAVEFDYYDVYNLSQVDKPAPGRLCLTCSSPYPYGSDFCFQFRRLHEWLDPELHHGQSQSVRRG
jgi:hypothetical protein